MADIGAGWQDALWHDVHGRPERRRHGVQDTVGIAVTVRFTAAVALSVIVGDRVIGTVTETTETHRNTAPDVGCCLVLSSIIARARR